tara:strand:- start:206 stop:424 length:219 start_codon:yes stop_codon:yes gene_type:complete
MIKKKKTEFYLLKVKSLSEGDLFVVDYVNTKRKCIKLEQRLENLEDAFNSIQNQLDQLKKREKGEIINLYEN